MEKFLVKKRIAKNIRQAKLYLVLFSVICLSISVEIFNDLIEDYYKYNQPNETIVYEEQLL